MSHDCDDAEVFRVYDEHATKARKAHACDACGETIAPSHVYTRVGIVDSDGNAETVKRCAKCQAIHKHLRALGDGMTWPAEKLDCGEEYESHHGQAPPDLIASLAFMTPEEAQARLGELAAVCACDGSRRCYWCGRVEPVFTPILSAAQMEHACPAASDAERGK